MKDPPNKEILFFSASHCNACKYLKLVLSDLKGIKVNVISNSDYDKFKAYHVDLVPTTIVLQDGVEVLRLKGLYELGYLKELLRYDQCILPKEKDIF